LSQEVLISQLAVVSTIDVRPSEKFGLWKDTLAAYRPAPWRVVSVKVFGEFIGNLSRRVD